MWSVMRIIYIRQEYLSKYQNIRLNVKWTYCNFLNAICLHIPSVHLRTFYTCTPTEYIGRYRTGTRWFHIIYNLSYTNNNRFNIQYFRINLILIFVQNIYSGPPLWEWENNPRGDWRLEKDQNILKSFFFVLFKKMK